MEQLQADLDVLEQDDSDGGFEKQGQLYLDGCMSWWG